MDKANQQTPQPTIYIIYNATSTFLGKLTYAYRKTTNPSPSTKPICSACEITHGPSLSLSETPLWQKTKSRIQNATIKQVHIDERSSELAEWMKKNEVRAPVVVSGVLEEGKQERFGVLMTGEDLRFVKGDYEGFLVLLGERARRAGLGGVKIR